MADNGGSSFLGFILGGIVVVVAVLAFVVYSGQLGGGSATKVELPKPTINR